MISIETLRTIALSFPEALETPHFEKTSFRIRKKIFATYDPVKHRLCVKLSLQDQDLFWLYDKKVIYPIPNKWGRQGWTFIEMSSVKPEVFMEALKSAYIEVAPKKLGAGII